MTGSQSGRSPTISYPEKKSFKVSALFPKSFAGSRLPRVDALQLDPECSWEAFPANVHAAVGIVFLQPPTSAKTGDPVSLALILRSRSQGSHRGQIAFPGGMREPGDTGPGATAAREISEEIGLSENLLTPHLILPPREALNGALVVPVLFSYGAASGAIHASEEVEQVMIVPWTNLSYSNRRCFRYLYFGRWRTSAHYILEQHDIWGLTARILEEAKLQLESES